jgi:hypothetical protein
MPTYLLASGEAIDYSPPPELGAFMDRVRTATDDPTVTPSDLLSLVYGVENPLLDTSSIPGRAVIRRAALEHPAFHIMGDLLFRKHLAVRTMSPEVVAAAYTVSVKDAARQLGITGASVRAAISGHKLDARMRNGQWYLRPESLAAYKVSNRGRKKTRRPAAGAPTKPVAKPAAKRKLRTT